MVQPQGRRRVVQGEGSMKQWVILKCGDYDHPYVDKDGKPRFFAGERLAEEARGPGDVIVQPTDYWLEVWEKR